MSRTQKQSDRQMAAERGTPRRSASRPGTQKSRRDREIEELRRELDRERRHSADLEREIASLKRALQEAEGADRMNPFLRLRRGHALRKTDELTRAEKQGREAASLRANRYRKSSYLRFLFESIMDSLPLQIISQLLHYLRKLRVVQLVMAIVLVSATVVLVTVLSAAALPFILAGTMSLAMLAWMRSRRMNSILLKALTGKHIRVLVPERRSGLSRTCESPSFFIRQAYAMAAEKGVAVIVVSPYPVSRRGLGGRGTFFTARREAENLYLVRRHYYFILRKRVLDVVDGDMTILY